MQQGKARIIMFCAAALIFLFAYTGFSKLMNTALFERTLGEAPLIGNLASLIAYLLPVGELGIALMLFVPRFRGTGFLLSFLLLILFSLYIIGLLLFSENLPCSCGGVLQRLGWGEHLLLNGVFMAMAAGGWYLSKNHQRHADNALLQ